MAIVLKTQEQIEGIRASCHLSRSCLLDLRSVIKAGMTTLEIDQWVYDYVSARNGKPATLGFRGYNHSSCISINDEVCHGVPNASKVLRDGDIVAVDVSTILHGYFGDTCMMFEIGEVSDEAKKLIRVTAECLDLGVRECKPNNYLGQIGYVIAKHAQAHGYSVVYQMCGHGVGLKLHEDPEVSHIVSNAHSGPKLKAGMTFTIEPMINQGKARLVIDKKDKWTARTIDGKLSAQFEHTVAITDSGVDVLTDVEGFYS